ncbi:hypothetical protein MTR67_025704 [Solanum verrucosum]|uniref:Tf2-1-like SH3-like domain-containing protein n=1 Tax=Solanum verrucosum TaxID=315347 RepID=A0AAF0TU45_SOLVR|nr:hypothetical protein MTR67_025704 [Solanum verrucosum]
MKGVMRFGKKGKLSPRYVDPYQILKSIGKVSYELEFPADLVAVHPVFHISLLKMCVGDPASVVPIETVVVKDSLSYEDVLVEIFYRQVRKLRNKEVTSVKVHVLSIQIMLRSVPDLHFSRISGIVLGNDSNKPNMPFEQDIAVHEHSGGIHGHHRWTVGGPTVRPASQWFVSTNSPRTQPEIWPSVNPRPDLRSVGQVMDSGLCQWIDAPKSQLQSQLTVDQHGPSFDAWSVGLTVGEGSSQLDENCDWVNFK